MHRVHTEPVHDQRGPILRDHQTARVRRETDAASDVGMRVTGVAGRSVYQSATRADIGERALDRGRGTTLYRVPELWLPDLRDPGLVLHTAHGHDNRVLQNIPGCPEDRSGGASSAEPPGKQSLLPGDQRQKRRGPGRIKNHHCRAGTRSTRSPGQQQRKYRDYGKCQNL